MAAWSSFLAPTVSWIGAGAVSAFGVGYGSGALMTRLGLSQRLDRGRNRLIAISSLTLYGVGLAWIPHADHAWQLGLIGFGCGMSHGLYYPALSSYAAERFHPLHTGNAMSLYMSAFSLGMFLGSPLWGYVGNQWGYLWIFASAGLLVFCSTLIFVISRSWRPAREADLGEGWPLKLAGFTMTTSSARRKLPGILGERGDGDTIQAET